MEKELPNFNTDEAPLLVGEKRATKPARKPPVKTETSLPAEPERGPAPQSEQETSAAEIAEQTFAPAVDTVTVKDPIPEPAKELPAKTEPKAQVNPTVGEDGLLTSQTFNEEWKIASMMANSDMVPEGFKNKPAAVMMAMQTARSRGLNPLTAIQSMANIFGRTQGFGELPLAEVFASGKLKYFEEFWFDKDGNRIDELDDACEKVNVGQEIFGAACICEAKDSPQGRIVRIFTMEQARVAGLSTDVKRKTWQHYAKRMLQMRARGHALKDACPEITAGIAMPGYDEHNDDEITLTPSTGPSLADKLNERTKKADGKTLQN